MAGEVKDLKTLKNTLKELNSGAHSAAQQFRDNARDLLETLQLVKGFGSELKEIDGELRQLFGAETNGPPSDEGAS